MVGAGRAGRPFLVVRGDGGDHACVAGLQQLDQQQANAAGPGVRQYGVPRFDLEGGIDEVVRGHALERQGSRRQVVDAIRHRNCLGRIEHRVAGVAFSSLGRGHPGADCDVFDALAELLYSPSAFRSRRKGERALVPAPPLVRTNEIDARGRDFDE